MFGLTWIVSFLADLVMVGYEYKRKEASLPE